MRTLVIVDGHNFLFKSYAVPFKFYSQQGTPLHVATTFLSLLRRSLTITGSDKPELLVVFDAQTPNSNTELLQSYKANRKQDYSEDADSPFQHLPLIKKTLDYLDIAWVETAGVEADDIIASVATNYLSTNPENCCNIMSSDSDFFQLISDKLKVIRLKHKGEYDVIDADWVKTKFGVTPKDYAELKAWVGDKTDNIEGIAGIGWMRGKEIIQGLRTRQLTPEEANKLELNRKLIKFTTDLEIECKYSYPMKLIALTNVQIFSAVDGPVEKDQI